jgi:hypothetical protein
MPFKGWMPAAPSQAASGIGCTATCADAPSSQAAFKAGEGRVPPWSASAASSRARRRTVFVVRWPTRKGESHAAVSA